MPTCPPRLTRLPRKLRAPRNAGARALLFAALALVLPAAATAAAETAELVWFRVDRASADRADDAAAARTIDYGTFAWVAVPPAESAAWRERGLRAASFSLTLGGLTFDPARDAATAPAAWVAPPGEDPGLQLVQLVGPTRREWLTDLENRGLRVVQYVHPFTYVVWGPPAAADALLAASDSVRWSGRFEPAYKVQPRWRSLPGAPLRWSGLIYRGAGVDATLTQLGLLGATEIAAAPLDPGFVQIKLTMPGNLAVAAAALPGVYVLSPEPTDGGLRGEMSDQVNVNNYDESNVVFAGYETWLAAVGLDGSGVVIANVDAGVQETHADLAGRMIACTGTTCSGSSSSHGTHTAGIMAADGASGMLDVSGFLRGLGVAPGASLVEQNYSPFYFQAGGMLLLMSDSHANGASLSGNSWGPAGSPLGYDDDTRQVDVGVRDARSDVERDQPLSYVLSIMNGNGQTSTQGTPDEAKNIFTIGSTKMQDGSGVQILELFDLSSNTAHGPALDGRKIPHLVAPGCSVDSTVAGNTYGRLCGTSMASPHVSGAVALFVEYYRNRFARDPSPALVKAAFLPVAHDLAGALDADGQILGHPFDSKQGWGRMDLAAVVDSQVTVVYWDAPWLLDETGEEWSAPIDIADPTAPIRLMLVWTDAPGHGLGGTTPAWNNDLDLLVEAGGSTYRGNDFAADGWSVPGSKTADGKNNTEGVFIPAGTDVEITVRVQAANLTSDGVPSLGDTTDQDFALVCYNCSAPGVFADGFESGDTSAWSSQVP